MKSLLATSSALVAGLCFAAGTLAQDLSATDKKFIMQVAQGGHAEIEASKMAQQKAASAEVKKFASQMVADHTKSGAELTKIANTKSVKPPSEPSSAQKAMLKKLEGVDAASFDKQYAEMFGVAAHEDMAKLFKSAVASVQDADVKAFAQKTLPVVEHHLEMGRSLKASTDKSK